MIVAILSRRVRLVLVVIVAPHRGMIVAMVLRLLVVVFIRPVLRSSGHWQGGGQ